MEGIQAKDFKLKCPDILRLDSYEKDPGVKFWEKFPFNDLPNKSFTKINIDNLKEMVEEVSAMNAFSPSQLSRAKTVIRNLEEGAPSFQKTCLPGIFVDNAKSTLKYGREITDAVAYWVRSGFVAGPFDQPPLPKFRVNPIMAVVQEDKVRPVLNVSSPGDKSFNSNIDKLGLEKVRMSSARNFGYTLKKCGLGASMSKSDLEAAYKQIPAPPSEWRLQGFCWLGKFFVELDQIFGAISAVSNFDQLGHTKVDLAIVFSSIRSELVHRHLDDVPSASPAGSEEGRIFNEVYKSICEKLNLSLAPDCENKNKAFSNSTEGKVLGVWFDTKSMSWSLPAEKKRAILQLIRDVWEAKGLVETKYMQQLMGRLNNMSLMSPFLKGFRHCLYEDLKYSVSRDLPLVRLSDQSMQDLGVWVNALQEQDGKLLIPREPRGPPAYHKLFVSDAAGCSDEGTRYGGAGAASIGLNEDGELFYGQRLVWDRLMIAEGLDCEGKRLGNKTTFLEMVAIILPFLSIPSSLQNQHIVLETDNLGCVFGWEKLKSKDDILTSILIRGLHLISFRLASVLHIRHRPRLSSWESSLADRLTRLSTMSDADKRLLCSLGNIRAPEWLVSWLKAPVVDWGIATKMLDHVNDILK